MKGFDLSRDVADAHQGLLDLAQGATTALQESDGRLKAFFDAKDGAADGAPLDAQTRLVSAAQALTLFDQPGLSPAQRAAYDTATDLAAQFQESDRRIGKAIEAAAANSSSPADAAGLVDAVGALTSRDLQRASPTQKDALDHASNAARTAAFAELVSVPPNPGQAPFPAVDEQLSRIRRVIGTVDPASTSPAQHQALDRADQAATRVRASDRRIANMHTAADGWRKSPSPLAGNQVAAAYAGLKDYDHSRFTAADGAAFGQLEDAFYVVSGKVAWPVGGDQAEIAALHRGAGCQRWPRRCLQHRTGGSLVQRRIPPGGHPGSGGDDHRDRRGDRQPGCHPYRHSRSGRYHGERQPAGRLGSRRQ